MKTYKECEWCGGSHAYQTPEWQRCSYRLRKFRERGPWGTSWKAPGPKRDIRQGNQKCCRACKKWLAKNAFGKNQSLFDGLSYICQHCESAKSIQQYRNKAKLSEASVEHTCQQCARVFFLQGAVSRAMDRKQGGRKYCSLQCQRTAQKTKTLVFPCLHCLKMFSVAASRLRTLAKLGITRKYCSKQCDLDARRTKLMQHDVDRPLPDHWRGSNKNTTVVLENRKLRNV